MVKLLLPLLLITAPVNATDTPKSICTDVFDIMMEYVVEGELEHKEAWAIYERCLSVEF